MSVDDGTFDAVRRHVHESVTEVDGFPATCPACASTSSKKLTASPDPPTAAMSSRSWKSWVSTPTPIAASTSCAVDEVSGGGASAASSSEPPVQAAATNATTQAVAHRRRRRFLDRVE
jgi:hypothetical protein